MVTLEDLTYLEPDLVAFRHDLHTRPELGFQETRTATLVAEALAEAGLEVHSGIGGTGVVGVLRRGNAEGNLCLRADMDALPITEMSDAPHRSQTPGVMHACGHDGHTTMLLGAARHLAATDLFSGTVYFLFQPNEEHGLGANAMLADGLLQRFPVDEFYAIHNLPGAPLGEMSTRPGLVCASETLFELRIKGQGGHASMPHVGVDALVVAAELILSLQTIVARKLAPGNGAVVSVTELTTDGARNVLPGRAVLSGDFRARNASDRADMERFMRQICSGVAATHDVAIDVDVKTEFVETLNDSVPCGHAVAAAEGLGLTAIPDRAPMSFSEDFGQFARHRPGCFLLMGNGTDGANGQPLHSRDYDFNDGLLTIGAAFWSRLVADRLAKTSDE